MNKSISSPYLGVLALLLSSTGFAANVTIVPSAPVVAPGSTFYVTVHGDDFPNTAAGDLNLTFNSAVVSVVMPTHGSGNPTCATSATPCGIGLAPGSPFNWTYPDFLGPGSAFTSGYSGIQIGAGFVTTPSGSFDAIRITFQVNPLALLGSPTSIVVSDRDGWTHADTFELIPVTYTQANVDVVPIPPAVWFFGSALGLMGAMRRKVSA